MVFDTPASGQKAVVDFCSSKIGCEYDDWVHGVVWIDLFWGMFGLDNWTRKIDDDNAFSCSELIFKSYEEAWIDFKEDLYYPSDIMKVTNPVYFWRIEASHNS